MIADFIGHSDSITSIAFSPITANHIASVSADLTLKIWEVSSLLSKHQTEVQKITASKKSAMAHDKEINIVRYSPNEQLIATGSQDRSI